MQASFPRPNPQWSKAEEAEFRTLLEQVLLRAYARGENIILHPSASVVLTDEDGQQWRLKVATDGTLSTEAYA